MLAKVVLHFTSLVWLAVTVLIVTRWAAELHSGARIRTWPTTSFDVEVLAGSVLSGDVTTTPHEGKVK